MNVDEQRYEDMREQLVAATKRAEAAEKCYGLLHAALADKTKPVNQGDINLQQERKKITSGDGYAVRRDVTSVHAMEAVDEAKRLRRQIVLAGERALRAEADAAGARKALVAQSGGDASLYQAASVIAAAYVSQACGALSNAARANIVKSSVDIAVALRAAVQRSSLEATDDYEP